MSDAPAWISPILTLVVSLLLPRAIAFVATSKYRIVNLAISYGSSAVLGALSAWASGQFVADIWMNLTIAITATQTAYNAYWKVRLS